MRILVTGGAGFIGSHVADACLGADHEVCVVDDLSTGRRENIAAASRFVEGDIRDSALVERVFAEFKPHVVTHQAAQTSVSVSTREPLRDAEINVLGSLLILEACVQHEVQRLVFASTGGAIYGEVPDPERARVGRAPCPLSPYACSKFAVENYLTAYANEHGLTSSVLRYANVYGPRQDPHGEAGVVAIFCQRLLHDEPIHVNARKRVGDAGCVRDYVYVDDVVAANLKAIAGELPATPVNVCTGEATTTQRLAETLKRMIGSSSEIRHAARREGDVERSVLDPGDPSPLRAPFELEQGLSRTVEWFRSK